MRKLLSLIMLLTFPVFLFACNNKIPSELSNQIGGTNTILSPYADANVTDRYYLSMTGDNHGVVYLDDFYYCSNACTIVSVRLPTGEMDFGKMESISPCSDPMCAHTTLDCPAMMRDPTAQFLIDAAESNGQLPVIYYFRCIAGDINFENPWESGQEYEIVRYDVAANQAKRVATVAYPIKQLMSYKDRLYFTTQTAQNQFQLNTVKKSGGEVRTLSPGNGYLQLIGANPQGIYCNDEKGNIYAVDVDLKSEKVIYTVKEIYPLVESRPAELSMFVEGKYVYFFADFKSEYFPWFNNADYGDKILFLNHSIRRVDLDNPQGDGEVVADEVFEYAVYGVYNGVLYYGPFIVETLLDGEGHQDSAPFYHSKGTIRGVRLDTLETFDAVSDCGVNFERGPYYINDRCIIGIHHPYRDGVGINYRSSGMYTVLYDFQTGAMYNVYNGTVIMKGKSAD